MTAKEDTPLLRNVHFESGPDDELDKKRRTWNRSTRRMGHYLVGGLLALILYGLVLAMHRPSVPPPPPIRVAFIGNSMLYFNDFPRFFQALASVPVVQNSCLHADGSIPSLLLDGNGMYPQFMTPKAHLGRYKGHPIYDYGACTVPQLLFGFDDRLKDPGYATTTEPNSTNKDPCRADPNYLAYLQHQFAASGNHTPTWDYVLINDNTRVPARLKTRQHSMADLEMSYAPWLNKLGAVPVFLWTQAYSVTSTDKRNMTGLEDVANFTSLTGAGYREYMKLLAELLPPEQAPRLAPVGLAFLVVYEERPDLWPRLFHSDHVHASPSGTFLQGCIIHYTLTGQMPERRHVLRRNMASLWSRARMMQHAAEPPNPFPDLVMAEYLYDVAERVMVHGHVPAGYIDYEHGEADPNRQLIT